MRPIVIDQRALRGAREELDSAREEVRCALRDVGHPDDPFPQRALLVEGVRALVADAEEVARRCRHVAAAVDDSLVDFDELDLMVGEAARAALRLGQVRP